MNNKVQNVLLGVLAVGLIGITVAYAVLTQQLTINGTAKVASTKWDIHFSDKKTGVAEGYAETGDFAKTSATTLGGNLGTLKAPGDKITYTFDIENAGDINAIIDNTPTVPQLQCTSDKTDEASAICTQLKYTIKYSDGATTTIAKGDKLAKATNASTPTKKEITIEVEYVKSAEAQTLATSDVTVTAPEYTITYVQDANN